MIVTIRYFMNEPANTWVTRAPWIWLPMVLVSTSLLGHVLRYRRLLRTEAAGEESLTPSPA